jgi:syntaxin 7
MFQRLKRLLSNLERIQLNNGILCILNLYSTELIEETRLLIKPASASLKAFTDDSIATRKLRKDFEQVINRFQFISKKAAQRSREFVLKAKEQQAIQIAQEHMTEEDTPLLSQIHDPALDQQIEINEKIIEDREQDLQGLERSIAEVNEIFRDLGTLVHEQQYLFGIED